MTVAEVKRVRSPRRHRRPDHSGSPKRDDVVEQVRASKEPNATDTKGRAQSSEEEREGHRRTRAPASAARARIRKGERWQSSLAMLCGETIALAPYWNKEFPGREKSKWPSRVQASVTEAAAADRFPAADRRLRPERHERAGQHRRRRAAAACGTRNSGTRTGASNPRSIGLTSEVERAQGDVGVRGPPARAGQRRAGEGARNATRGPRSPPKSRRWPTFCWEARRARRPTSTAGRRCSRVQDREARSSCPMALRELAQLAEPAEPQPVPADVGPDSGDELQLLHAAGDEHARRGGRHAALRCDRTRH